MGDAWRPDKTRLDETDRQVLADVEEYGWHCLHVHDEGRLPFWSFSIGVFKTWRHPEFVVFGLPESVAHELLAALVERVSAGERFVAGQDYDDVLEGFRCCFLVVDPQWYSDFLGYAQWFHESAHAFPVLQLVWPDKEGRYPWERGFAIAAGTQPVLVSERDS